MQAGLSNKSEKESPVNKMVSNVVCRFAALMVLTLTLAACASADLRGTGDLGLIIERKHGSVLIVEHTTDTVLGRVTGLGDLSHASAVMSRDARYAYVFGRDGGLTKVDLLTRKIVGRTVQGGNSIGGAISQDGKLVAVSNYKPGGIKVFDAETLALVADIPAVDKDGEKSKTVGLVDAPGQKFVFGLYNAGEIWLVDMTDTAKPEITKFKDIGKLPYDALLTPDGRYYIAGLFGEDGMALLDLWHPENGTQRILSGYGRGEKALPVYKMPHLEGWTSAGGKLFVPAVGRHEVLVINPSTWKEIDRIKVHGQPIFVMARPDGREVYVNFAIPHNDTIEVIDVEKHAIKKTLKPGKAVLHMEFTPRGDKVWMSVRDDNKVKVYDTRDYSVITEFDALKPSGIFFTNRAHKLGL